MATMEQIEYLRQLRRYAEQELTGTSEAVGAYQRDLLVGTVVTYQTGHHRVIVQIVAHWGPHRCRVRNRHGEEYFLDFDRITGIVHDTDP